MGIGVGANAEVDAGAQIAAEAAQGDAAAHEDGRAMGDTGAGGDDPVQVIAAGPMQPGMVIQENTVADDRAFIKQANLFHPLDRG